jgi:hypothetical protein
MADVHREHEHRPARQAGAESTLRQGQQIGHRTDLVTGRTSAIKSIRSRFKRLFLAERSKGRTGMKTRETRKRFDYLPSA